MGGRILRRCHSLLPCRWVKSSVLNLFEAKTKIMADFSLKGSFLENSDRGLKLKLPSARSYQIVPFETESDNLKPGLFLKQAVRMRRDNHKWGYSRPTVLRGYQEVNMHNTLQRILSRHPFPLFQGPLILHLDLSLYSTKMGKWYDVNRPTESDII